MNKLGHFEENLLAELRQVVAEQAVAEPAVVDRPVRPRGRLVLATAGAGVLAAALVVGLPAMHGDRTPAAHAVTDNPDGTVTITVNRLEDPDGLERELAARGITADVSYAPPGKTCRPFPERFQRQDGSVHEVFIGVDRGDEPLTVWPDDLEGKTLVLEGRGESYDPDVFVLMQYVASGPVAPCVLVDMPVE
jgi:hypothetical protein